nr:site-specific DNA-methyltransferase [Nocardioides kongjuensis]
MDDSSVHAVVTDPPYGLDAAGKMLGQISAGYHLSETHSRGYADNDAEAYQEWCGTWARECLRVLKPGGHLIAFGGTRTIHRLTVAVEDAGFEIRDELVWLYGSGVPKGLNLTDDDGRRTGWGTTLKPAHEPAVLARKPLAGTVAQAHVEHGTGAMNLGACMVEQKDGTPRWPANVVIDDAVADLLADASRFFFVAKPGSRERPVVDGVRHPTVKPLSLMRELVRLVTPPGGVVLDPFAGSGTTLEASLIEGMQAVGIERDSTFLPLIRARVARAFESIRTDAA